MNGLRAARAPPDRAAAAPARCRSRRAPRRCRAIDGSRHAARIAAARTSAGPATYRLPREHRLVVDRLEARAARVRRRPGRTRRGRNGLAGATTASRSPGRSARGFSITRSAPFRRRSGGARRGRAPAAAPCRRAAAAPTVGREEPLLGAPLARERVLDARHAEALVFDRVDERLERRGLRVDVAPADQHAVAAGRDRQHGRLRHRVVAGDRLHLEVVAQDHALEAQLARASRPRDDPPRQRRRPLLVERRHEHVRRHDGGDARLDRGPERHELDLAQPIGRMLDERQLEMRVGARVAVTGKVLAARGDALRLQRRGRSRARAAPPRRPRSASARSPMTGFFGFVWTSSTGA